jgi:hypothetical protein
MARAAVHVRLAGGRRSSRKCFTPLCCCPVSVARVGRLKALHLVHAAAQEPGGRRLRAAPGWFTWGPIVITLS